MHNRLITIYRNWRLSLLFFPFLLSIAFPFPLDPFPFPLSHFPFPLASESWRIQCFVKLHSDDVIMHVSIERCLAISLSVDCWRCGIARQWGSSYVVIGLVFSTPPEWRRRLKHFVDACWQCSQSYQVEGMWPCISHLRFVMRDVLWGLLSPALRQTSSEWLDQVRK